MWMYKGNTMSVARKKIEMYTEMHLISKRNRYIQLTAIIYNEDVISFRSMHITVLPKTLLWSKIEYWLILNWMEHIVVKYTLCSFLKYVQYCKLQFVIIHVKLLLLSICTMYGGRNVSFSCFNSQNYPIKWLFRICTLFNLIPNITHLEFII